MGLTMKPNRSLLNTVIRNTAAFSTATRNPKRAHFTADSPKPTQPEPNPPQKPKTVKWAEELCNTASFIGTVIRPVKRFEIGDRYGSCTTLLVKPPSNPNHSFRISLKMWDEMADISLEHIKENDLLHVSGNVESYTKTVENNIRQTFYEVVVKEINYVGESEHMPTNTKAKQLDLGGRLGSEINRGRLRLWQLFFTNPSEWYDHRTTKSKPNHPDFKHKDTGEALWINTSDPPWVKKQLQLLDSNSRKQINKEDSSSKFSTFV